MALLFIGLFLIISIFSICTYRLFFHPLSKYPGPLLGRLTRLYGAYHSLYGDGHIDMHRCHLKYGPIVRYGPNKILFNTSQGLDDIYNSNRYVKKSKEYISLQVSEKVSNTISCRDKIQASHRRRALARGFTDSTIRSFEQDLLKEVDKLCDLIQRKIQSSGEEWSSPINMASLCNWFTLDVIGKFGFGRSFNLLEKPDNRFISDVIDGHLFRVNILVHFPSLINTGIDMILYPKGLRRGRKFLQVCREYVERTFQEKYHKQDLISHVLNANGKSSLTPAEMWEESKFIVAAGSETSAVGLASVFFYLVHNQTAYAKLSEEVHGAFSTMSDIYLGDKLEKCRYLAACIDESLRMSPPTAIALWREVQKELNVDGVCIPAGMDVGVSIYAIHHNEDIFPDSFTYKPERWIVSEENTQDAIDQARAGFNPFSLGPRACPARPLALSELKLVVARVIFQFDFRKSVGKEGRIGEGRIGAGGGRDRMDELQMRSHLTTSIKGPYLEFRSRSVSAELKA